MIIHGIAFAVPGFYILEYQLSTVVRVVLSQNSC